ncbi:MAG: ferritin-like domain-containing protein, partial [Chloroflexota bacterium]|nr:ferritin-like domain-containing protein [Chloroflexota bacterium]
MALNQTVQEALNRHINEEFYASYLYLSMSAHCDSLDLPGFAHWMRIQSQEEYAHAALHKKARFRLTFCATAHS